MLHLKSKKHSQELSDKDFDDYLNALLLCGECQVPSHRMALFIFLSSLALFLSLMSSSSGAGAKIQGAITLVHSIREHPEDPTLIGDGCQRPRTTTDNQNQG